MSPLGDRRLMQFVDLSRRFEYVNPANTQTSEDTQTSLAGQRRPAVGWLELLQHRRVVLLAEAGSGKTREMREQARRLQADGHAAFFVALESLGSEEFTTLLSRAECRTFDAWRSSDSTNAWFFLDAGDELKLVRGRLDRALTRLSNAIDGLLHRTHIVLSFDRATGDHPSTSEYFETVCRSS